MTHKIFLFGLDNAGKTSLSQAIRTGSADGDPLPTKSFDIKDLIIKDIEFKVWDAPGQKAYRASWGRGMDRAEVMVFVLDVADADRFEEAKGVLEGVLNDMETRGVPLVFLYHKMDLQEANDNLNSARATFKLPQVREREVYAIQTAVGDSESIEKLKDAIASIIEKARWG
ncbi:MAG: ADP-ribosylation factor-like protein [Promethearchaeota archaeon]